MKLLPAYLLFLLLSVLYSSTLFAQGATIGKHDTILPKAANGRFGQEIYWYKEKAKLQELEIRVLKETVRVDSLSFGKDSLMISYFSATGKPLKTIRQKFYPNKKKFDDSTVVYFNKSGLMEYKEYWQNGEKKKIPHSDDFAWTKMKLTYRRYEYDNKNRLIRQVVHYPTPRTIEIFYTYDAAGKQMQHSRSISSIDFWDAAERKFRE